jgi:diadenosine tetraphosphate (Ap4A) HIT family hydrolase
MVPHTHFHVIPRFPNDEKFFSFPAPQGGMISPEKAKEVVEKITAHV